VSEIADRPGVVDHGSSKAARWLRARRIRIALAIAAVEGILVALLHDVSRWTVLGLAAIFIAAWFAGGRESRFATIRQLSWIAAASQALAVIAVVLAFILAWTAFIVVAIFAVIAVFFLITDRR
jgi:hypothetical protein